MNQTSRWRVWMALALFLVAIAACRESPQNTSTESATVQPVEEFTEETLTQYRGKAALLNFWASWCAPCRAEMPDLEAVYQKYRDKGLVILAVNLAESDATIISYVSKLELTFPVFSDRERKTGNKYGIRILPTTLFINRDGQIVTRKQGALDQEELSLQVEGLLGQ